MGKEFGQRNSEHIMKVGILTRRAGFNLGSSLQAYAITKLFAENGCDCKIINYDESSAHLLWRIRPIIDDIQWALFQKLSILKKINKYKYLYVRNLQYSKFQKFEKDFLPLTSKVCRSNHDLRVATKEFQILVCGSDQIWSPFLFDSAFYFGFLSERKNIRTIAYAPSIGTSNPLLISTKQVHLLKKIDYVSCREEDGSAIIKNIINRDVPVVLDPTLMIHNSEWDSLADSIQLLESSPYILCYFLGSNIPQKFISELSELTGYKILNIQMFNRMNNLQSDRELTDIGPCEFLNLIKNASWVCTDSFHATIFSYIYKRKMSIFERFKSTDKLNQNSRIHTLVNLLKIKWALTSPIETPDLNKLDLIHFDSGSLKYWQLQSLNFIKASI